MYLSLDGLLLAIFGEPNHHYRLANLVDRLGKKAELLRRTKTVAPSANSCEGGFLIGYLADSAQNGHFQQKAGGRGYGRMNANQKASIYDFVILSWFSWRNGKS